MSYVFISPDKGTGAPGDLDAVGTAIEDSNGAVATSTTEVTAAEGDVSPAIATLFGTHAGQSQAISAEAASFHSEFVRVLNDAADGLNASPLRTVEQDTVAVISAPIEFLVISPVLGDGTSGASCTGRAGGAQAAGACSVTAARRDRYSPRD